MGVNRTAVVKLSVPDNRRDDLKRTINTFRDATQRFADRGWDGDDDGYVITSGNHLQRLVYDDIREDTDLHADLCVGAADHAAAVLSSVVEKMKEDERVSQPVFTSNTTVYNTSAIIRVDERLREFAPAIPRRISIRASVDPYTYRQCSGMSMFRDR